VVQVKVNPARRALKRYAELNNAPRSWRTASRLKYLHMKEPCANCPWRLDTSCDTIPNFNLEMSQELAATEVVSPMEATWALSGALTGAVMQCHESTPAKVPTLCAGFAIHQQRARFPNHLLRFMASMGQIRLPEDTGLEIHADVHEMIAKHERQAKEGSE